MYHMICFFRSSKCKSGEKIRKLFELWLKIKYFVLFSECEAGFIGPNCSHHCIYPYHGKECKHTCHCDERICNHVTGCFFNESKGERRKLKVVKDKN